MEFKYDQEKLILAAQAHNLAEKLSIDSWNAYLVELDNLGLDVEKVKKIALGFCHDKAIKINNSLAIDAPEKVRPIHKRPVRYRNKLMEKLAGCETLEDYINLGQREITQ